MFWIYLAGIPITAFLLVAFTQIDDAGELSLCSLGWPLVAIFFILLYWPIKLGEKIWYKRLSRRKS